MHLCPVPSDIFVLPVVTTGSSLSEWGFLSYSDLSYWHFFFSFLSLLLTGSALVLGPQLRYHFFWQAFIHTWMEFVPLFSLPQAPVLILSFVLSTLHSNSVLFAYFLISWSQGPCWPCLISTGSQHSAWHVSDQWMTKAWINHHMLRYYSGVNKPYDCHRSSARKPSSSTVPDPYKGL